MEPEIALETPAPDATTGPETPPEGADKAPVAKDAKAAPKGPLFDVILPNGEKKTITQDELLERYKKSVGLEKRVQDADRYEKAFGNFVAQTKNPDEFLKLLNSKEFEYDDEKQESLIKAMLNSKKPKLVEAVKKWLWENEVEPSTLTEEQRKVRDLEKYKSEAEKEREKRESDQKAAENQAEVERIWNDYRFKIGNGLKEAQLPETEGMVVRVARKAMLQRRAGQPADIQSAIKAVKEELSGEYLSNLEKATEDEILNLLPEAVLKKINAAFLKKIKKVDETPLLEGSAPIPKAKKDKTSEENKQFWKNIGRGVPVV